MSTKKFQKVPHYLNVLIAIKNIKNVLDYGNIRIKDVVVQIII
jgi:hypothetical protein